MSHLMPTLQRAVLDAITMGPLAWSSAVALEAAGHCSCVLEAMEGDLLERWDLPEGLHWTLSPWGAVVAEVELVERFGVLRWHGPEVSGGGRLKGRPRMPWEQPEVGDPVSGPSYLIDPVSEQPVKLFGSPILIDPRLAKRVHRPRGRKRRAG